MTATYDLSWLSKNQADLQQFLGGLQSNLNSGHHYAAGQTITYSFYTNASPPPDYFYSYVPAGQQPSFTPFTAKEKALFKLMTDYAGAMLGVNFQEVAAGTADINVGMSNQTTGGYASYPGVHKNGILSITSLNSQSGDDFIPYYKTALWHEFGHALGLSHPNNYPGPTQPGVPFATDTQLLTTMSYDDVLLASNYAPNPTYMSMQGWTLLDWHELISLYNTENLPKTYNITINKPGVTVGEPNASFTNNTLTAQVDLLNPICLTSTNGFQDKLQINSTEAVTLWANLGRVDLSGDVISNIQVLDEAFGSNSLVSASGYGASGEIAAVYISPSNLFNTLNFPSIQLPDQNNTIYDGNYFFRIQGGKLNDTFHGFVDGLSINGNDGIDSLYVENRLADYLITKTGTDAYELTPKDDPADKMHLTGIEYIYDNNGSSPIILKQTALTIKAQMLTQPSQGVLVAADIPVEFNDSVQRGTGNIQIHKNTADGEVVESFNVGTSNLISLAGNKVIINPTANLENDTHYFVTIDSGALLNKAGLGLAAPAAVEFKTIEADQRILGTAADETFQGGSGNDHIDGNAGKNAVAYAGSASDYIVRLLENGSLSVSSNLPGHDGSDNLVNIQEIIFSDKTLETSWLKDTQALFASNTAKAGILSQFYAAYLDRAPDTLGLSYWASNLLQGKELTEISTKFFNTSEFAQYNTITSQSSAGEIGSLVRSVYENLLNRNPDVDGLAYWTHAVQSSEIKADQLVLNIINSVNSQTNTQDANYLKALTQVVNHFSVINGLSSSAQASHILNQFHATYLSNGESAAIAAANGLSDLYLNSAPDAHQLVVQLTGLSH